MGFWRRRKRGAQPDSGDTGQAQKSRKPIKQSPPMAMEVKLVAIEALESGLSADEASELVFPRFDAHGFYPDITDV